MSNTETPNVTRITVGTDFNKGQVVLQTVADSGYNMTLFLPVADAVSIANNLLERAKELAKPEDETSDDEE